MGSNGSFLDILRRSNKGLSASDNSIDSLAWSPCRKNTAEYHLNWYIIPIVIVKKPNYCTCIKIISYQNNFGYQNDTFFV